MNTKIGKELKKPAKSKSKSRISDGDRLSKLSTMPGLVFSIQDLATIWSVTNRGALRVMVGRYTKRGLLYRIWRRLYAVSNPKKIDPTVLGIKSLRRFAYVSCETVLFDAGIINQRPTEITIVGNVSKRFSILGYNYRVRKMQDRYLYDNSGIVTKQGINFATASRAKKDLSYFNSKKYYDANI